jgi:hypothetical protein
VATAVATAVQLAAEKDGVARKQWTFTNYQLPITNC